MTTEQSQDNIINRYSLNIDQKTQSPPKRKAYPFFAYLSRISNNRHKSDLIERGHSQGIARDRLEGSREEEKCHDLINNHIERIGAKEICFVKNNAISNLVETQ